MKGRVPRLQGIKAAVRTNSPWKYAAEAFTGAAILAGTPAIFAAGTNPQLPQLMHWLTLAMCAVLAVAGAVSIAAGAGALVCRAFTGRTG